jgi:DNA-binding LacI/PurR family transcriptional regulator
MRVPSEKALSVQFNVSRITSKKALELLDAEGYLSRRPGIGSFVAERVEKVDAMRSLALVMPAFSDAFGTKLLSSIVDEAWRLGYKLILKNTHEDQEQEKLALRSLVGEEIDGILLIPVHGAFYNSEIIHYIPQKRPLVLVDRKLPGLPLPCVSTNNIAAADEATSRLLDAGHQKIAYLTSDARFCSTLEDRKRGFIHAFAAHAIPLDHSFFCQPLSSLEDMGLLMRYFSEHPDISAAITTEFDIALFLREALEALDRRVPEDFSIITFDSPYFYDFFTHVKQDEDTMGRQAVGLVDRLIRGELASEVDDLFIPAKLEEGRSLAPPPFFKGRLDNNEELV